MARNVAIGIQNFGDLFEGFSIWEDEEYRKIQGTYPELRICVLGKKVLIG